MPTLGQKLIQQGRLEGKQEGINTGLIIASKEMLIEALNERFNQVHDEQLMHYIQSIQSHETLKELFKTVLKANSLDDFKQTLSKTIQA